MPAADAEPLAAILANESKLSADTVNLVLNQLSDPSALTRWLELLEADRPAMMRAAQRAGVAKLNERQALANTLGRAVRTGALQAPPRPGTPPTFEEVEISTREKVWRFAQRARAAGVASELEAVGLDGALLDGVDTIGALSRRGGVDVSICEDISEGDAGDGSGGGDGGAAAAAAATTAAAAAAAVLLDTLVEQLPTGKLTQLLEALGVPPAHMRALLAECDSRVGEATLRASPTTRGLCVGFWSNQLCERGTEVAMYDYADYAESLLGCSSYILYDGASPKNLPATVAKVRAVLRPHLSIVCLLRPHFSIVCLLRPHLSILCRSLPPPTVARLANALCSAATSPPLQLPDL